jgi:hypothetical protein
LAQGGAHDTTFDVPSGQALLATGDYWAGSTVDAWLTPPSGPIIDPSTTSPDVSHNKGDAYESYGIRNPQAGTWTLYLYGADLPAEGETVNVGISYCAQAASDAAGDPCTGDDDADGCTDTQELAANAELGGLRDPLNPWDFFDTDGNKQIDLFYDIFGVAYAYGTHTGEPGYSTALDRSAQPPGAFVWEMGPPNGTIDLFTDIFGVAYQYGHHCT